jgi:hypothetical protein
MIWLSAKGKTCGGLAHASVATLSIICATSGQTRGTPSPRFSAVAATSAGTTGTYSTRAAALRSRNKRAKQQFQRSAAKRSLLAPRCRAPEVSQNTPLGKKNEEDRTPTSGHRLLDGIVEAGSLRLSQRAPASPTSPRRTLH